MQASVCGYILCDAASRMWLSRLSVHPAILLVSWLLLLLHGYVDMAKCVVLCPCVFVTIGRIPIHRASRLRRRLTWTAARFRPLSMPAYSWRAVRPIPLVPPQHSFPFTAHDLRLACLCVSPSLPRVLVAAVVVGPPPRVMLLSVHLHYLLTSRVVCVLLVSWLHHHAYLSVAESSSFAC